MKGISVLFAGVLLLLPLYSYSASSNSNENGESISILQDQVSLLEKQIASQLKISGYADVEYRTYANPTDEDGFRLHHFSLFFKKQINEKWRFFSEIEFEDAPFIEFKDSSSCKSNCSGKIFVEAVNIDYEWTPQTALRFGRFFTPAGIWSIDHYPPFVPTQERPLHIRKMFPQLVDGLDVFGNIPLGGSFLSYDLFVGNGEGNTGKQDKNSKKAVGLNLNFTFPVLSNTEFGATFYQDTLNDSATVNGEKSIAGIHTKLSAGGFTLQAEYADGTITPLTGGEFDTTGYYGQISYDYVKWLFGLRYDFYEKNSTIVNGADIRNVFFINYRVDKDIVIKLEHIENEPEDSSGNTHFTIASVAIYLGD